MATIQTVNNGDSGLVARTKINNNAVNLNAALAVAEALLITDNASLNDFQKITDAIEEIQSTLTVDDPHYDTLQKIRDKLKLAETTLSNLGTASNKDVGTAIGNIQENGAAIGNSQTVETDSAGKFITAAKNTAYNKHFGTGNTDVARGDASYLKADTYTETETNALLATKEATANKGVSGGYASLNGSGHVPASQLPSYVDDVVEYANLASFPATGEAGKVYVALDANLTYRWSGATYVKLNDVDLTDYLNKTTDSLDDVNAGTTNKHFTATLETKLNGIEDSATADQTAAEIKTVYESNADTNAFTDNDEIKLAGIAPGATANSADATLLDRANHTGEQTLSTISDSGALAGKDTIATGDVDNNAITTAKIQQFASKTVVGRTTAGTGDVEAIDIATTLKADLNLTSTDVGLDNVDNTSDADKPVSTAQQTALDAKLAKSSNFTDVEDRQTALDNLTDASNATSEDVLTLDTSTGNAVFKALPAGSVPSATEIVAGVGEIATQAESEAGIDDTNKFLNPLKGKQAIAAHNEDKIFYSAHSHTALTYGSGSIVVEFPSVAENAGVGLSYSNGIFTVSDSCRLYVEVLISFRNNSDTLTDDTSYLEIQKSTDSGANYNRDERYTTINPSEHVNAGNELVQGYAVCASFNSGDKFRIRISDVTDFQIIADRTININQQ